MASTAALPLFTRTTLWTVPRLIPFWKSMVLSEKLLERTSAPVTKPPDPQVTEEVPLFNCTDLLPPYALNPASPLICSAPPPTVSERFRVMFPFTASIMPPSPTSRYMDPTPVAVFDRFRARVAPLTRSVTPETAVTVLALVCVFIPPCKSTNPPTPAKRRALVPRVLPLLS